MAVRVVSSIRHAGLMAVCAWVVGCADYGAGGPTGEVQPRVGISGIASGSALSSSTGRTVRASSHRIQSSDVLLITVFDEPDLSVKATVSPEGTVSFPLLKTVDLAGLTVLEAEQKLTGLLAKDYLVSPSVTVALERGASRHVYLLGQVRTPGSIEMPADEALTVVQAISAAGGFTEFAARDRVTVMRSHKGRRETLVVNVAAILRRGDISRDVALEPEDVVSVPLSRF